MLILINSDHLHIKVFLVTGGWTGSDRLDTTEVYDPSVGSWTAGAKLPRPMTGLTAAYIENQVLIFGEGHFIPDTNIYSNMIFSGGYDGRNSYNTILQYNSDDDEFTEVGTMLERRRFHAISVVPYSDYSQYCQ